MQRVVLFALLILMAFGPPVAADEPVEVLPAIDRLEAQVRRAVPHVRDLIDHNRWRLPVRIQRLLPSAERVLPRLEARQPWLKGQLQAYFNQLTISVPAVATFVICPPEPPPIEFVVCGVETGLSTVTVEGQPINLGGTVVALPGGAATAVPATRPITPAPLTIGGSILPGGPAHLTGAFGPWSVTGQTTHYEAVAAPGAFTAPRTAQRETSVMLGYAVGPDTRVSLSLAAAAPASFHAGVPGVLAIGGVVESRQAGLAVEQRLGSNLAVWLGFNQADLSTQLRLGGGLFDQAKAMSPRLPRVRPERLERGLAHVPAAFRGQARQLVYGAGGGGLVLPDLALDQRAAVQSLSGGLRWRANEWLALSASLQRTAVAVPGWRKAFTGGTAALDVKVSKNLTLQLASQNLAPAIGLQYQDASGDVAASLRWQARQPALDQLTGGSGDQITVSAAVRF